MLNFYHPSLQTFGKHKSLINEKTTAAYDQINDWFFEHFHKTSLIQFGFMSVIRYLDADILYLKLYYIKEISIESKKKIEDFVCAFYANEKFELKYSRCNIIMIPIEKKMEEADFEKQKSIGNIEALLQLQLKEDSWVGVDKSGTEGAYTNSYPNKSKPIYNSWKQLLFEGFLEPGYIIKNEPEISNKSEGAPEITEIQLANSNFKLSVGANCFSISWEQGFRVESRYTIPFKWRGHVFNLTAVGTALLKSYTAVAELECFGKEYRFGVGMSSIGGGRIGSFPDFRGGNYRLEFSFGKYYINVVEHKINPNLTVKDDKETVCFQFLL